MAVITGECSKSNRNLNTFYLTNLCGNPGYSAIENEINDELLKKLKSSDGRGILGPDMEIFESIIRYSPVREFPKPGSAEMLCYKFFL